LAPATLLAMATRESKLQRGRRRGRDLMARMLNELRLRRSTLSVSQAQMAQELGVSQAQLWRIEAGQIGDLTVVRLAEMASVLGLEPSITLHDVDDPIHDKGQQPLARRFEALLAPVWSVTSEALLPMPGDRRAWDKLLRLRGPEPCLVGADLETRIRDIQALVRRTRLRERDGGVDHILIVLSASATNRRLVDDLRDALGPEYATPPRRILAALRAGRPLPGSGVLLI
jgi:transcriptional regulator with XRE-family HTH domain